MYILRHQLDWFSFSSSVTGREKEGNSKIEGSVTAGDYCIIGRFKVMATYL